MTKHKKHFIKSIFESLKSESYVLLKWLREDLTELSDTSDLDILITDKGKEKIENLIHKTSLFLKIEQEEYIGVNHYYLYFKNGDFLQIDLLNKFIRKDLVYLSSQEVLANHIEVSGIKTYPTDLLFEHTLLFSLLNGSGLSEKYRQYFETISSNEQQFILNKFNQKYSTHYENFLDASQFNPAFKNSIVKQLTSLDENSIFRRIKNKMSYISGINRQIRGKRGHIITFSGVDGAGKSTIINDILGLLGGKYRKKVVVLRHRPSLLPIISAWKYGKQKAEQKSIERLPRQGKNNSKISSYLRFSYYYVDYVLGQFYIWAKYLIRGYTVVYDRYYFDFIIDGKRSNINMPPELPKLLYTFVAKPDLNFFLYADADTIIKRKQELSSSVITQLTKKYLSLFKDFTNTYKGKYIHIENIDRQKTLQTILNHYLKLT